jgi:hypothetical protein
MIYAQCNLSSKCCSIEADLDDESEQQFISGAQSNWTVFASLSNFSYSKGNHIPCMHHVQSFFRISKAPLCTSFSFNCNISTDGNKT